jgi:hypothetical protein
MLRGMLGIERLFDQNTRSVLSGQTNQIAMSALPPIADIPRRNCDVRFGPIADIPV